MTDRITFRLGDLAEPLATHCQSHGQRPSDVARLALAKYLGQPVPTLRGHVANLRQYRKLPSQRRQRRSQ